MFKNKLIIFVCGFVVVFGVLIFSFTKTASASTLTSASVTMTNSRMSYKALVSSGAINTSLITIQSGSGDANTNHLFPGDKVCFTDAGNNVCRDNTTYTVANIVDGTHFDVASPIATALTATDYVVASQSGTLTIGFTTVNAVPVGGKIIVTIPANDTNTPTKNSDGMPDVNSTVATNGFDTSGLVAASATVTTTGCGTVANWGTTGQAASVTVGGSGTTDTTISWTRASSSCAGGSAIVISIPGIVNPAPITSGHTQGTADVYGVVVSTTDGTNTIDSATPRAAPVEAVLVSANVDESLSMVVAGLASGGSYCGNSQTVTTTATSIPWGHLAAANTFYYAAQSLTVNTNATSGYAVTLQENDQMGRNGNTCTGNAPSSGNYTFGTATCIRDTVCSASGCSESVMGDWTSAANYPGLGYTEASQSGTDAVFFYNQGGRTFNGKSLADVQGGDSVQTIMSNAGPVSGSQIYICYKISIPGTQPSGYYYNIARYTATATF